VVALLKKNGHFAKHDGHFLKPTQACIDLCCEGGNCCEPNPDILSTTIIDQVGPSLPGATVYSIGPATRTGGNTWRGDLFCDGIVSGNFSLVCLDDVWQGHHTSCDTGEDDPSGGVQVSVNCDPFEVVIRYTFESFPSICGFAPGEYVEIAFTI
jgi:hypothetical protein